MLLATTRLFVRRAASLVALTCALSFGLPQSSGAASLRPDGLIDVQGHPLFPIGLLELGTYAYPDWAARIHASGANMVWDIEIAYADTLPRCTQVMQASADGGWYLMVGSGDTWGWDDPNTPQYEVSRMMYEPAGLTRLLNCAATHPGRVLAFANRDEPSWTISRHMVGDIDAAHVHETYAQLHAAVPGAIVAMNHAPAQDSGGLPQWLADLSSFATASDVTMFACYPYPAGPGTCTSYNVLGYPDCKMDRLPEAADVLLGQVNRPGQPLWMIVQAFKGIPLKESRWEAWASVVHGATGLFWAGWDWVHPLGDGSTNWPITQQTMSEVSALQSFLVGRNIASAFSDNPDVEVRAFLRNDSQVLLVAIARNGFTGQASIHLPLPAQRNVNVLYEGRRVSVNAGVISDHFDGYEAHVYQYGALSHHGGDATATPELSVAVDRFGVGTYPNPSTGRTTVRFGLPKPATVVFTVFDAAGRRVAMVGRGTYGAGMGELVWNGRDDAGQNVAPGVYFLRATTSQGETATSRVLIRR